MTKTLHQFASVTALLKPVTAVALATALAGCLFQERVEELSGPTMGSTYSVKYVRGEGVAAHAELQAATETFLAELDRLGVKNRMMLTGDAEATGHHIAAQAGMVGPMSTILMGIVILGEPFTVWVAAGTALVLAGIFVFTQGARRTAVRA